MMASNIQDFTPVVIGNRSNGTGKQSNAGEKKGTKSTGISGKLDNQVAAKLDGDETKPPETMGSQVGKAVAAARATKKWKAEDLARQLSLTKNVILEIESGKHKRDNKLLQKMENKLGVWLTGDSERIGTSKEKEVGGKAQNGKKIATTTTKAKESGKEEIQNDTETAGDAKDSNEKDDDATEEKKEGDVVVEV